MTRDDGGAGGDGPVIERFQPPMSAATEAFWDATRERRYLVQWCTACDVPIFYPREVCPNCLDPNALTWRESNGTGHIYAHSVQHRPAQPGLAAIVPYVVALVDLDAGCTSQTGTGAASVPAGDDRDGRDDQRTTIRIMSNIVDADLSALANGDSVTLTWEPLADGRNLAVFSPT